MMFNILFVVHVLYIIGSNGVPQYLNNNLPCDFQDLWPNPENPHTFLQCVHGSTRVMPCQRNIFVFCYNHQWCTYPNDPDCDNSMAPTTPPPQTTEAPNKCPKGTIPHNCTHNFDRFPVEDDCTKFWLCYNDCKSLQSCQSGLVWNDLDKYCSNPSKHGVTCPYFESNEVLSNIGEILNSEIELDASSFNDPMCYQLGPSVKCRENVEPDAACKSKFRICENGWYCHMKCKNNYIFNKETENCEPAEPGTDIGNCYRSPKQEL